MSRFVDFGGKPAIYPGTYEDNELGGSLQINGRVYEAIVISGIS